MKAQDRKVTVADLNRTPLIANPAGGFPAISRWYRYAQPPANG